MASRNASMALALGVLLLTAPALTAQSTTGRIANPEVVEFDVPSGGASEVDGYRVELFPTGSDTKSAAPVKALEVSSTSTAAEGKLRVDIRGSLEELPAGEYVATVRTIRLDTQSARSEPTQPFLVSHSAVAQDLVLERRERFWTKIAMAVGAVAMIIPFVVR
jgi:hypothetical protein